VDPSALRPWHSQVDCAAMVAENKAFCAAKEVRVRSFDDCAKRFPKGDTKIRDDAE